MDRKRFRDTLLLALCIIGIYFLFEHGGALLGFFQKLWMILAPFLLGGALAFILNVPMRFFERHVLRFMDRAAWSRRLKRAVAMIMVLALAILAIYLVMSLVIPELINTVTSIVRAVPGFIARVDEMLAPYGISISEYINSSFTIPSATEMNALIEDMIDLALKGVAFSGTVIGTVYQNVLSVFFTIMFTIYFLYGKDRLRAQFKRLMAAYLKPEPLHETLRVAALVNNTFSSFITGQCLEALILGGLFFVAMSLFHMPYVLLISVFITITALIPVIGAWMGCIVGAFLILVSDPLLAMWFVVMFLVLQQIEGNLIYPHVMGNAIGLPSIWVLFAVVLGEGLLGIIGMLLFIPLTSVAYSLLREQVNQRLAKRGETTKTDGV